MPEHGAASVTGVIPTGASLSPLGIGLQAIQPWPYRAGLAARRPGTPPRRPPLSRHAVVPFRFRIQVSRATQEPPSEFLPTASGIQRSASRLSLIHISEPTRPY